MSAELSKILSRGNAGLDSQRLLEYISGTLPEAEKIEVEAAIAGNPLLEDALEGLRKIQNKNKIQFLVDQLKLDLQHQVKKKNRRARLANRLIVDRWTYLTIIIILVICVIGYLLVRSYGH